MPSAQINNGKLLNAAARALLRAHISKPVSQRWRYSAKVAIDTICKTYAACPTESAEVLYELLAPERLPQFPHDDLFDLAHAIKFLGPQGDNIVLRLLEAAFESEPEPGEWEQSGRSAILPMRMQTSDQWKSIHYSLSEYYTRRNGDNAALMTEGACCAWNAVVRHRQGSRKRDAEVIASMEFNGVRCELRKDNSHIWGREFAPEESRIVAHFEKLLRGWAGANDAPRINAALDAAARRNRTSLIWSILMDVGAEHPESLGCRLEQLLTEPACLYDPDYSYAAAALLGSLHKSGDWTRRERLERLIVELPNQIKSRRADSWEDGKPASWVLHAQNRLLAALQEEDIVSPDAHQLWLARKASGELQAMVRPHRRGTTTWTDSDEEVLQRREVNLQNPVNAEMFRLREGLKPFVETSASFSVPDIERQWSLIGRSEKAVAGHRRTSPEMSQELWGYLVSACAKVAQGAQWPKNSHRWQTVRRILLHASRDAVPAIDEPDSKHDVCAGWGWPSPRIDAAKGLARLVAHLREADAEVSAAIRALSHDGSAAVRFNLASVLPLLAANAPGLMWELVDSFIATESNFTVLDAVVHSLDWLWAGWADDVAKRLRMIELRVRDQAPLDHTIHETLAHSHLFQFLRTGRPESQKYISDLIAICGEPRATKALLPQLHTCRAGGWMTAGDPKQCAPEIDAMRARTWKFLLDLLTTAHSKLQAARTRWLELKEAGNADEPESKEIQSKIEQSAQLVDGIASELYFASGAFADKQNTDEKKLNWGQTQRFWEEAAPLLKTLATEPHPHTAYELVQTLHHLLPCNPEEVFLVAAESIRTSSTAGFQFESLAVPEVVKIVQRLLADHREILRARNARESPALKALLEVLDIFVEAGWPEARALTHRLEEIYR
jgi:hypothetical protein